MRRTTIPPHVQIGGPAKGHLSKRGGSQGTSGDDILYGTNGRNTLNGGDGRDQILGGRGRDTLLGGADDDRLSGDGDADDLVGGSGADVFEYNRLGDSAAVGGAWSADTGDTIHDFAAAEGDRLDVSDLALTGIAAPATLTWQGLSPAAPSAYHYGLWSEQSGGNTFVYADTTGDGVADLALRLLGLVDLEASHFLGAAPGLDRVRIDGTEGDDWIEPYLAPTASQAIYGYGGQDTIHAGGGADWVLAGSDDDAVYLEDLSTGDWADGGAGSDYLEVEGRHVTEVMVLENGDLFLGGTKVATGFEAFTIYGGSADDRLTSGDLYSILEGAGGDDTVTLGAGGGMAFGQSGHDTLLGGAGYSRLLGGQDDDVLLLGSGGGQAYGGTGNDRMTAGAGADEFLFYGQDGHSGADTILGFEAGADWLHLSGLVIANEQQMDVNGDAVTDLRLTLSTGGTVDLLDVGALGASDVLLA